MTPEHESCLQETPAALRSSVSNTPAFLCDRKHKGMGVWFVPCRCICQLGSKELAQSSVCHALSLHTSELTVKLLLAQMMNMHAWRLQTGDKGHHGCGCWGRLFVLMTLFNLDLPASFHHPRGRLSNRLCDTLCAIIKAAA